MINLSEADEIRFLKKVINQFDFLSSINAFGTKEFYYLRVYLYKAYQMIERLEKNILDLECKFWADQGEKGIYQFQLYRNINRQRTKRDMYIDIYNKLTLIYERHIETL